MAGYTAGTEYDRLTVALRAEHPMRISVQLRAGDDQPHAFVHGLTFAMRVSAVICFGAAIAAALLVRKYRHAEQAQPLAEAA